MPIARDSTEQQKKLTQAQEIFSNAKQEYKSIVAEILKEERDVMYLKKRTEIHKNLYEIIKRVIK